MRHILEQALKEWCEFKRDRLSLSLAFLLPLITLLLFGFGVRMQSHNVLVSVHDNSKTTASRAFIERLEATNTLHIQDADKAISVEKELASETKASVTIPQDFESKLLSKSPTSIDVSVDGTDIVNARLIDATIRGACTYFVLANGIDKPPVQVKPNLRVWFNPGLKESLFIVPGVFGIVLWMFPSLLACVAMAREKEQGTVLQVFVSSIKAHELVLGKALVYTLVGLAQAVIIISLATFIFGLHFLASAPLFFIALPIYVLCSVLFGMALGSCANSQSNAVQGVSSLGFFTCLLLSGFVYPISNIPFPLSLFSYLVPARYFIEVSRDSFERGMGGFAVVQDITVLILFCLGLFSISWFSWRQMKFKE